jgi:digeranylgeranylglycerophospholipid reductase
MEKNDMHDVIVVGAGPAGLYSAGLLEKSLDVLVLEEHKEIGRPVQCSGLVSANLKDFIRIDRGFVENEIRGAILHSGGDEIKVEKKESSAFVINRERFDRYLARDMESEILKGMEVDRIDIREGYVSVRSGRREFRSSMILGCDGPGSFVRNHFGVRPREVLRGVIGITGEKNGSGFVELWFDKSSLPDGFFWRIPRGETTEYGMLSGNAGFGELERFFRLKDYRKRAGLIPVGFHKTYFPGTLLVGDAASQVKPWSGGGIIYGLTCAGIAAGVVGEAFERGDFSEGFLKRYETLWREKLGKNITLGLMFREFYRELDSRGLEDFFRALGKKELKGIDMDFPLGFIP